MLMNLGHIFLFHKRFCKLYFRNTEKNAVTLIHSAQWKHTFLGEIKKMSKSKKISPRNKVALELLHQILGHISTRSLMGGDTANVWEDIELRIDPDLFCTSCHISSMKKKTRLKIRQRQSHLKSGFSWILFQKQHQNN